ncbi:1-propanol dehydrogenase PduQ [Clostridium sediminicola]|uniref:1-propanol dehydrogenase PduQ n=1 Tax=Clostridium sediminicola TaxID=3114879 RepID=UPI0031F254A6
MKTFSVKTKIHFGSGALQYLSGLKCDKVLIVTDPFMMKAGFIEKVTEQLKKADINFEVFSDIVPDPPLEVIVEGIKALEKANPDIIIALGGGSAIDACKAIFYFEDMVKKKLNLKVRDKKLKFIAIPTTSGTGSEVTAFSVVTDREKNVKYPLVDEALIPDEAILDASLVKSVPSSITVDTGMDVLTHAMEAFLSINASDCSDALSEKAIKLVFEYLPKAYKDGNDEEARERMHNASCIAGMAFTNASLGINHSMAHILGAKFHIPHGKANALLLPYIIEFNANIQNDFSRNYTYAAHRYAKVAKLLGLSSTNVRVAVRNLINTIKMLNKNLGIPSRIREMGISQKEYEAEINNLSLAAYEDGCTATNPRKPTVDNLKELFRKIY